MITILFITHLQAEMLDYHITMHYPLVWNHRQQWTIDLNGSKTTYHFLYEHKVNINPFVPTVAFSQLSSNICCPRDCVSRHNEGT